MSEFISVKKSEIDDRVALQAAINKAAEENVGTVVIEKGEYLLDGSLLLPNYTRLVLDGAELKLMNTEDKFIIRNENSVKNYAKAIEAEQRGITISGFNGAKIIDGTILLSNANNCTVEGISFSGVQQFGVAIVCTVGCKLRKLEFSNIDNGIAFGIGARDTIATEISGVVNDSLFVMSDELFRAMKKHYHTYDVTSNIIRGVNVCAKHVAYMYGYKKEIVGHQVEKIIFSDICGEVNECAFLIENGKYIVLDNIAIKGKLLNDSAPKTAYTII